MKLVDIKKRIKSLIGDIILDCGINNCSVHLEPVEEFENNMSGYFSNEGGLEINVATHNDDWWEILAHEYCHFLQWKEGLYMSGPAWKACNYIDPWIIQERRIKGEGIPHDLMRSAYSIIISCEDDCMKRTYEMIQDYSLYRTKKEKIDYIKRSNLYLYLLELEFEFGKIKNEDKFWSSYKLFRFIPEEFCYDPSHPEKFEVPNKVRDFIIESEFN